MVQRAWKRIQHINTGRTIGMSSQVVPAVGAPQNTLLAALPAFDWERVKRYLSVLETSAGETLCELESRLDYAYFPTTSIISVRHVANDGGSTEVATIGNEGLVGVSVILGGGTTANRVVVQNDGHVYRLKREILQDEFNRGGVMQHLLLRFTHALLAQISQMAACNRRHSIDQQVCRWLLTSLDRLASDELTMTHEMLANTLGVRREGITEAAHKLQGAGFIVYRRGRITVLDRIGVEALCCECYRVMRREYNRLPRPYAHTIEPTPLELGAAHSCSGRSTLEIA
jgi:CRP-like cAMP-binding protein